MTDPTYRVISLRSFPQKALAFLLAILFCFVSGAGVQQAQAQRNIRYPGLVRMSNSPNIYFDSFKLPGKTDSTLNVVLTFRIDYSRLPFKKMDRTRRAGDKEYRFYAITSVNTDIFKDDGTFSKRKRGDYSDIDLRGMKPAARSFWRDTAYAETYEQTQSNKNYMSGYLHAKLAPGNYGYVLQLNSQEGLEDELSRKHPLRLSAYDSKNDAPAYFLDSIDSTKTTPELKLLNFGNNVYFGKDFEVLVLLPDYQPGREYRLQVQSLDIADRDTTSGKTVWDYTLKSADILQHRRVSINPDTTKTSLQLDAAAPGQGYTYALLHIPNRKFPNSAYRLEVKSDESDKPFIRKIFRSRWIDMPTSLLNLDVSIDMLHYIVDDAKIKELKKGSFEEREKKFRDFWKQRDPTPDTEYNELMAEYYRRIDYAFEHFSSMREPGYETDQGKIYIKYGPPQRVERKFPPGEPVVEIWHYRNRQFAFQATSGFGDYELISN